MVVIAVVKLVKYEIRHNQASKKFTAPVDYDFPSIKIVTSL